MFPLTQLANEIQPACMHKSTRAPLIQAQIVQPCRALPQSLSKHLVGGCVVGGVERQIKAFKLLLLEDHAKENYSVKLVL